MTVSRCTPALFVFIGTAALAACTSSDPLAPPPAPPTLRGTLTAMQHSATASGLSLASPDDACGMRATAGPRTRVLHRTNGRLRPAGLGAVGVRTLAVGDAVEVWTAGPVLESCPVQARAAALVVDVVSTDPDLLARHWVHSREEDAGGTEVFRPEGSRAFPPDLFRAQYVFRDDGSAEVLVPHPADVHYFESGTWTRAAQRPDLVRLQYGDRSETLRVLELGPDVLRLTRVPS